MSTVELKPNETPEAVPDPNTDAVALYGTEIEVLADLLARIEAARPQLERFDAVTALATTTRYLQTCVTRAAAEELSRHLLGVTPLRRLPPLGIECPVVSVWKGDQ